MPFLLIGSLMINCLLVKINTNSRGLQVRSYHTLAADELSFGRGAECTIHLPDPRLAMHHAIIKRVHDNELHLLAINGELEVDATIKPHVVLTQGTHVMIGPYLLTVEPTPPDLDLTISLALVHPLPDDFQDIKSRTHAPLPGAFVFKKRLSMWMMAFIALFFIALPLAQNLIPSFHQAMSELPVGFDRVWSPGHFSNAHLHFSSQCSNCHEVLTQRVTDNACMKCHGNTTPHITRPKLQQHVFKKKTLFSDGKRCAECHQEHKAPHPLARQDNANCISCHGDMKSVYADTVLPDIHAFDRDHPEFRLTFRTGVNKQDIERIPQSDTARLIENPGLKFPHIQHVGKVQGPNGMWDIRELSCNTCHQPEGKEMRIKPLSFKRDCQACHESKLEVGSGDNKLKVPHGSEQNAINTLKVLAPKDAARHAETLAKSGCIFCHEIEKTQKGEPLPWRIVPLKINQDWFSKAHFTHASHQTQQCTSCHKVEESETSADVAMPNKASCLRCHSGNKPKHKRIASSCMSCHEFHSEHITKDVSMTGDKTDTAEQKKQP